MMENSTGDERERLLDPTERISEILLGLIMAVTIVGTLSIATPGPDDMRTVTLAAFGSNIAWGLVDAVMYLVRTLTERNRNLVLARRIGASDAKTAHRLIVRALPEHVAALVGTDEIEGIRRRLVGRQRATHAILKPRDYLAALSIFLMVVIATFPVVAPFVLTSDAALAMRLSRVITLVMLFVAGFALGHYAGHAKPVASGLAMTALGVVLIAAVEALSE
jgi:nitrate reductase NapE component